MKKVIKDMLGVIAIGGFIGSFFTLALLNSNATTLDILFALLIMLLSVSYIYLYAGE